MGMMQCNEKDFLDKTVYFSELRDYGWIDDWKRTREILPEIERVKQEINRISQAPFVRAEALAILKSSYDELMARRRAIISGFLEGWTRVGPAFKYQRDASFIYKNQPHVLPPFISWQEVEQSFYALPEPADAMSAREKEKQTAKLRQRLQDLEAELERVFPARFHGQNDEDKRGVLVEHWRRTQMQANGPVGPEGMALKYSPEPEREAWKRLKLSEFVNEKGLAPYDVWTAA